MLPSHMPELRSRDDVAFVRDRLRLHPDEEVADEAVAAEFEEEVGRALTNWYKRFDNTVHIFVHT
jgi:hypothetical protein